MFNKFELSVGLRYLRAKQKNSFVSFISMVSIIGIALGVMALITVLSVMNGFQRDIRNKIIFKISIYLLHVACLFPFVKGSSLPIFNSR